MRVLAGAGLCGVAPAVAHVTVDDGHRHAGLPAANSCPRGVNEWLPSAPSHGVVSAARRRHPARPAAAKPRTWRAVAPCLQASRKTGEYPGWPNENHGPVWEECMIFARALAALVFAASVFATGAASAQSYPTRPITMICPFPPGGATDTIARVIQDSMARTLGQPIV